MTTEEMAVIRKLYRPESFKATENEARIIGDFIAKKIVRAYPNGDIGITAKGSRLACDAIAAGM